MILSELKEILERIEEDADNGLEPRLKVTYQQDFLAPVADDASEGQQEARVIKRVFMTEPLGMGSDVCDLLDGGEIPTNKIVSVEVITKKAFTVKLQVTLEVELEVQACDDDEASDVAWSFVDDNEYKFGDVSMSYADNVEVGSIDHSYHEVTDVEEG